MLPPPLKRVSTMSAFFPHPMPIASSKTVRMLASFIERTCTYAIVPPESESTSARRCRTQRW